MKIITTFFILLSTISFSQSFEKIDIARGPEDFVLDGNRLIISCAERRKRNEFSSGIWNLNLDDSVVTPFDIIFKVKRLFDPIGISLLEIQHEKYLFVINHYQKRSSEIICFRIDQNQLIEIKAFRHPTIKHPNSIFAVSLEEFYFTNDLKITGSVGKYKNGRYQLIAKYIPFANGIIKVKDDLFVTSSIGNKLLRLTPKGDGYQKETFLKMKGSDNIEPLENGKVLIACHPNALKFMRYMYNVNESKISPFSIYEVDLETGTKELIFEDDGKIMSAGSSAVYYRDDLYVGQIFGGFLLKVKKKEQPTLN